MTSRPSTSQHPACPRPIRDADVRGTLRELLRVVDPPDTVVYSVESARETEGARTLVLRFPDMLGETVTGVLIIPATAEPQVGRR